MRGAVRFREGVVPLVGISGGLSWGPLAVCVDVSAVCSLLLLSPLSLVHYLFWRLADVFHLAAEHSSPLQYTALLEGNIIRGRYAVEL